MISSKNLSSRASNIFETSIFSEIVKQHGTENLHFWRNKNGNEIDFVFEDKHTLLPIEVKTNFRQFRQKNLASFLDHYHLSDFRVIGFEGTKKTPHEIYPWELSLPTSPTPVWILDFDDKV